MADIVGQQSSLIIGGNIDTLPYSLDNAIWLTAALREVSQHLLFLQALHPMPFAL